MEKRWLVVILKWSARNWDITLSNALMLLVVWSLTTDYQWLITLVGVWIAIYNVRRKNRYLKLLDEMNEVYEEYEAEEY